MFLMLLDVFVGEDVSSNIPIKAYKQIIWNIKPSSWKRPYTKCKKKINRLCILGVQVQQCFSLLRPEFDPPCWQWLYVIDCSDIWVCSVYSGVLSHHWLPFPNIYEMREILNKISFTTCFLRYLTTPRLNLFKMAI